MPDDSSFDSLIRRVRSRDPGACSELVRRFEPEIRRFVRLKMQDPALRRFFDSADICQSVLGNFFVRVVTGQFDLGEPEQLLKLLTRMARNKLRDQLRRPALRKRREQGPGAWDSVRASGGDAADELAYAELEAEARRRLTDEERRLADRRVAGLEWGEIAAELGGTPEGLRKQLARAVARVCAELGLDSTCYA